MSHSTVSLSTIVLNDLASMSLVEIKPFIEEYAVFTQNATLELKDIFLVPAFPKVPTMPAQKVEQKARYGFDVEVARRSISQQEKDYEKVTKALYTLALYPTNPHFHTAFNTQLIRSLGSVPSIPTITQPSAVVGEQLMVLIPDHEARYAHILALSSSYNNTPVVDTVISAYRSRLVEQLQQK